MPVTQDQAEQFALSALAWLAGQEDLIGVFLSSSGLSPDDLRQSADQPETLAAVLDFILMDDRWVLDFAQSRAAAPDMVLRARAALPGGAVPHWT